MTQIHIPAAQDALAARLRVVLANAVTGVYGISGSGKSSIADTATEYAFERFDALTLYYTADLGGYGTRRVAFIRKGIAFCWDPRNHINPMETMTAMSHGAFPAYLLPGGPATQDERDRGWAPPDCELVYPIRQRWTRVCGHGHVENHYYDAPALAAAQQLRPVCPTCQHPLQVQAQRVKDPRFKNIGHRVYDSMTAMNEWGFSNLGELSAAGLLPKVGDKGGTLLGGADALVQGSMKWSGGSQQQVGFMQNRSHDWIGNIKAIEGHVVPPTMTFLVEMSKGDDESGGLRVLGPKIQGNARTSSVPAWLGNCLHASREPQQPGNPASPMVYRLWFKTHVDPLDVRAVPYMAKPRGTPVGMPEVGYFEDPVDRPWAQVNLGVFYDLLAQQVSDEEARLEEKYGAKLRQIQQATAEEVTTLVAGASADSPSAALAAAAAVPAGAGAPAAVVPGQPAGPAAGVARPGRRVAGAAPPVAVAPVAVTAAPAPPPVMPAPATTGIAGTTTATGQNPVPSPPAAVAAPAPVVAAPVPPAPPVAAAPPPPPPPPPAAPAASTARPGSAPRRAPRPPVGG